MAMCSVTATTVLQERNANVGEPLTLPALGLKKQSRQLKNLRDICVRFSGGDRRVLSL